MKHTVTVRATFASGAEEVRTFPIYARTTKGLNRAALRRMERRCPDYQRMEVLRCQSHPVAQDQS